MPRSYISFLTLLRHIDLPSTPINKMTDIPPTRNAFGCQHSRNHAPHREHFSYCTILSSTFPVWFRNCNATGIIIPFTPFLTIIKPANPNVMDTKDEQVYHPKVVYFGEQNTLPPQPILIYKCIITLNKIKARTQERVVIAEIAQDLKER